MSARSAKPILRIVAGLPRRGKTAAVIAAFKRVLDRGDEAAFILPTARASRSLKTELLLDGTFDAFGGPRVITFVQFAEAVLERHAPGVRPIDTVVADEVLSRIIGELGEAGEITYHRSVADFRGFIRAVREFITELKRAEVTPQAFAAFARRKGASRRDRELSAVYTRYQQTLQERDLYDAEGRFWRAKVLVAEGKLGPFADLKALFLDAFYDFTQAQLGLLELLARRGVAVTMSLPLELDDGRSELFDSPRSTLTTLREHFDVTCEEIEDKEPDKPSLAWVANHLFRPVPPEDSPQPDALHLIRAPGAVNEVREIAREVKRLHVDEHVGLERMAVVFRSLANYRGIVEEVFDEFGIPVHIGQGVPLSLTPIGKLVLQIVSIVARNWRACEVLSLLKSNYVSTRVLGIGEEGIPLPHFVDVCIEAGIIGGRKSWHGSLRRLSERLVTQQGAAGAESDEELLRVGATEELKRRIEAVARAGTVRDRLFDLFDSLGNARTTADCIGALREILRRLEVESCITADPDVMLAARDLESLAAVEECLDHLLRTVAIVGEDEGGVATFFNDLKLFFDETVVARRPTDFGRVLVGEVHEMRPLAFDVVFLGGLLEREFPRMHREGPFYDDTERERMNHLGVPIPPRRQGQQEERFLFYLIVTRARRKLYLSYPVTDREGKEKLASYYVDEVRRLFAPAEVATTTARLSDRLDDLSRCRSLPELRRATITRLSEPKLTKEDALLLSRAAAVLGRASPRAALACYRGLSAEAERESFRPFGWYDGVLAHEDALADLKRNFGEEHTFSITSLETYGACPFAFFCRYVLNVTPLAEPPEELEAVDEGTLLHRALREFYSRRLRERGETRIAADEVSAASETLCRLVDAHLDRFHERNPDLSAGLLKLQRAVLHEQLGRFVAAEAERQPPGPSGLSPALFEVGFGLEVNPNFADPNSTTEKLVVNVPNDAPARIGGKIDRIDVGDDPDAGPGFVVIDYKRSGSRRKVRDIQEGTALQRPVYLEAARRLILKEKHPAPLNAFYYSLRDAATDRGLITRDAPSVEELIGTALGHVADYVGAVRRGEFPVMRRDSGRCAYCDYNGICRYTEWRERKKTGEVVPWFDREDGEERDG